MFDFPNDPSDGELVVHPNGKQYEYNLTRNSWAVVREPDQFPADISALQGEIALIQTDIANLSNFGFLILE
jgi:hypothetical protein|tara:strand:+ start:108 stop:320 length:213 start_codon:yes stop_codon:yes gene_type:complete